MDTSHQLPSEEQMETLVLRRLRGELDGAGAARLAAALLADQRLADRAAAIEHAWQNLELSPVAAAESVAPQVMARLRGERQGAEQRSSQTGFAGSPAWARVAAALALVAGLGAGWNLDRGLEAPAEAEPEVVRNDDGIFEDEAGFAEGLWLAAETDLQDDGELQ
jgi:anti-sigma factor RsiW